MIDSLGFHTDRDLNAELAELDRQINALTARVTGDTFSHFEDRWNDRSSLDNLRARAAILAAEVAIQNQEMERLTSAIRTLGDADLGFIAYVVFGPAALPMEARYEIRLIERTGGYTVAGTVRRNVTADQIADVQRELLTVDAKRHGQLWGRSVRDYRTQTTAY